MTEKTPVSASPGGGTRWEEYINDDLQATAFDLRGALMGSRPRPAFVAALEARLLREQRILTSRSPCMRPRWWHLRTRRSLLLVALALGLTVLGGAAYAALVSPGDQVLLHTGGGAVLVKDNLGARVSLTQRACGFALTVNRVYVDQQQAIVAYTASAPHGYAVTPLDAQDFMLFHAGTAPQLSDGQGHSFAYHGEGGAMDTFGHNAEGHVIFFTPPAGFDPGQAVHVHLSIPYVRMGMQSSHSRSHLPACVTLHQEPGAPPAVTVKGPFTYALTVPVPAAHVATVQRSVHVGGLTVRLTRLEITPLNTRVYFTVTGGDQAHISWYTLLQRTHLVIPSQTGANRSADQPAPPRGYDALAGTPYGALPDCSSPAATLTAQQRWLCHHYHNFPWWASVPQRYRPVYSQGFQDPAHLSLCVADFALAPLYTYRGDVTFIFGPIEGHTATAGHRFALHVRINPKAARAPNLED